MKVVIDISKEDYQEILEDTSDCGTPFENRVFSAIQNGIVLSKEYDRLININNEQKCDCRTCVNAGDYIVCCMYDRDIADIEGCDFYQEDVTD